MSAGLKQANWRVVVITRQNESVILFRPNADGIANNLPLRYARSDLKPTRSSSVSSFGCSHAAKCPPFSSLLKWISLGKARSVQLRGAG
jgi:hypothetical protein